MATTIRIKRSTGTSAPGSLKTGELAYSAGTGTSSNGGDRLYWGKGDDGSGNATSVVVIGGEYFANALDHTPGTLTASSAIITDAANKIDNLKVDNIDLNGNTISTTNTNGNLVLDPNGSGAVDVNTSKIINLSTPTLATDAATKAYVDSAVAGSNNLAISGDTGTDTVELSGDTLSFTGGVGLTSVISNNNVRFFIDSSGVVVGSYGSATAVPVLTINAQGQITAATTAAISTTLNLSGDATTGDVSLKDSSLTIFGGEGIDVSVVNNQFTIAGELATTTNKGVASFDSATMTVASGAVAVKAITIGNTSILPGSTSTTLSGLTQLTVDNVRLDGNSLLSTSGTLYLDPTPIDSEGGDVVIRGNLYVQGTTTTINSSTVSINDKNIVLADSAANAAAADGAGLTIGGDIYSGTKATFTYDGSNDRWAVNKSLNLPAGLGSLLFNGVSATEVIEDHLITNFFLAGEGIDLTYDDNANTLTVAAELATVLNAGVASFDSAQFSVTTGRATIFALDGGTY